jgi:SET domain-containing protein
MESSHRNFYKMLVMPKKGCNGNKCQCNVCKRVYNRKINPDTGNLGYCLDCKDVLVVKVPFSPGSYQERKLSKARREYEELNQNV